VWLRLATPADTTDMLGWCFGGTNLAVLVLLAPAVADAAYYRAQHAKGGVGGSSTVGVESVYIK
jgi:hypothetical protein